VICDRWSLLVIRDTMFGNTAPLRELPAGSGEGIARTSSPTASDGSPSKGSSREPFLGVLDGSVDGDVVRVDQS
jgi:hypothetical protein